MVQLRPILQQVSRQLLRLLVILVELQGAIREKSFERKPELQPRMTMNGDTEEPIRMEATKIVTIMIMMMVRPTVTMTMKSSATLLTRH